MTGKKILAAKPCSVSTYYRDTVNNSQGKFKKTISNFFPGKKPNHEFTQSRLAEITRWTDGLKK